MSEQKLTKKQKKSLAFRQGKSGPRKSSENGISGEDGNAIPVDENQDAAGLQLDDMEGSEMVGTQEGKGKSKGKGKDKAAPVDEAAARKGKAKGMVADKSEEVAGTKRKRVEEEDQEGKRKGKKRKGMDGENVRDKVIKQRFILFVGNLKFTVTADDIKAHFAVCDPLPSIRLMTPKPARPGQPTTSKTKGCAFLEFSHRNALQQALKLHQSELQGRRINVELTAGGGGKSQGRLTKLQQRNRELNEQRSKKLEKTAADAGEPVATTTQRPQRYSTTSGLDQVLPNKRTWTVGDVDDGETHRGGVKHQKKRGAKKGSTAAKDWSTGVNSIPVG